MVRACLGLAANHSNTPERISFYNDKAELCVYAGLMQWWQGTFRLIVLYEKLLSSTYLTLSSYIENFRFGKAKSFCVG